MPVLEENDRKKKARQKCPKIHLNDFFNNSNLQQLPYISDSVESNLILLYLTKLQFLFSHNCLLFKCVFSTFYFNFFLIGCHALSEITILHINNI